MPTTAPLSATSEKPSRVLGGCPSLRAQGRRGRSGMAGGSPVAGQQQPPPWASSAPGKGGSGGGAVLRAVESISDLYRTPSFFLQRARAARARSGDSTTHAATAVATTALPRGLQLRPAPSLVLPLQRQTSPLPAAPRVSAEPRRGCVCPLLGR
ncbi:unnamed protein product [Lampetra fluviatilis]